MTTATPEPSKRLRPLDWALLLSACVFLSVLLLNNATTGSLEPRYSDHIRHLRWGWAFLTQGPGIYGQPMQAMERLGDARAYIWLDTAYPYPPGAVLLYAPGAWLIFGAGLSTLAVYKSYMALFTVSAHLAVALLARRLHTLELSPLLRWPLLAGFYFFSVLWGANGQYGPAALLPLVLAGLCAAPLARAALICLAFFFKFQGALAMPVAGALCLAALKRQRALSWPLAAMGLFVSMQAGLLYVLRSALVPPLQNPIHLSSLMQTPGTAMLVAFTLLWAGWGMGKERKASSALGLFCLLMLGSINTMQHWYVMWLFPLVGLMEDRRNAAHFALWVVALLLAAAWVPDFGHLLRLLMAAADAGAAA